MQDVVLKFLVGMRKERDTHVDLQVLTLGKRAHPIDPPDPLFELRWIPREVMVDDVGTVAVQVDPLRSDRCAD